MSLSLPLRLTFKQYSVSPVFVPFLCCTSSSPSFPFYSPTPKVSWLRKDGELSESRTTKDMFDRRLRFSNISEADGGEYQCIAENSQGKVTHTYTVTVEGMRHTVCTCLYDLRIMDCEDKVQNHYLSPFIWL